MSASERPPFVVLHGSVGAADTMHAFAAELAPHANVFTPNLLAHGGRPLPERLSYDAMVDDVIAYCDEQGLERTFLFGFSLGGTLALSIAHRYPERLYGVSAIAPKYVFDNRTLSHWLYLADDERIKARGEEHMAMLSERHHPQPWSEVARLNRELFRDLHRKSPLSEADLRAIAVPALLFSSDADQIVPLDEALRLGELLPNGRMVIFRGRCHPIDIVPTGPIATALGRWIAEVSAPAGSGGAP